MHLLPRDDKFYDLLTNQARIATGTFFAGWRIVHTMGKWLTNLKPRAGFCAETGAAGPILFSDSSA